MGVQGIKQGGEAGADTVFAGEENKAGAIRSLVGISMVAKVGGRRRDIGDK